MFNEQDTRIALGPPSVRIIMLFSLETIHDLTPITIFPCRNDDDSGQLIFIFTGIRRYEKKERRNVIISNHNENMSNCLLSATIMSPDNEV